MEGYRGWWRAAASLGLIGVLACSPETTIVQPRGDHTVEGVARIEVASPTPSIEVSASIRLEARAFCLHDMEIEDVELEWSSVTEDLVEVDVTGSVTALRSGTAVIRARAGDALGEIVIPVLPFGRTLGPEGGAIQYREGLVHVVVGEGALLEPTRLAVEEVHGWLPQSGPGGALLVPGTAYGFEPDGLHFERPVELRFRYRPSDLPATVDERWLRVHRLQGEEWVPLETSIVDADAGEVAARTSSFSVYGLIGQRPAAADVSLAPGDTSLLTGTHLLIEVRVTDSSGEVVPEPEVVWSSSDPTVALVDSAGEVVALRPGWATITATAGEARGEVVLAVYAPLTTLTVEPGELWLTEGETDVLEVTLEDETGASVDQIVNWTTDDASVARVSQRGTVEAVGLGEASLLAESGGRTARVRVHVTEVPTAVLVTPADGYYLVGVPLQLTASVVDASGNEVGWPVTWAANDPSILVGPGSVEVDRPRTVLVTAAVRALSTTAVLIFVTEDELPGSIELDPPALDIKVRETVPVRAIVRDRAGEELPGISVAWTSADVGVITVDEAGAVTGVGQGATLLIARAGHVVGMAEVAVAPPGAKGPPNSIEVWPRDPALEPGATAQIGATVFDENGDALTAPVIVWTSSDEGVVTVSETGLLTAVLDGTATVSALYEGLVGSVTVTVGPHIGGGSGGHEEGLGNNLSWPVIFTEGYGVTGLPVATDPGVRPTPAEGVEVTGLPFFPSTNVADHTAVGIDYYLQKGENTWQAEWLDGSGETQSAEVRWGDNLTHHTFSTHAMIRVETSVAALSETPLTGFAMTHLYGQGSGEMQGTDGSTGEFTPSLYTVTPRLTVQKLDNETLEPVFTAFSGSVAEGLAAEGPGSYGAEVNVAGKIIYGFNLRVRDVELPAGVERYGWWRLTFSLDESVSVDGTTVWRGLSLDRCGNTSDEEELTYTPVLDTAAQRTTLDIWIASASGGGGGGTHGGGGGGSHSEGGCGG